MNSKSRYGDKVARRALLAVYPIHVGMVHVALGIFPFDKTARTGGYGVGPHHSNYYLLFSTSLPDRQLQIAIWIGSQTSEAVKRWQW